MKACVFTLAVLLVVASRAVAYTVPSLLYGEDLFKPADLVVIAEPVGGSKDTLERSVLRGVTPNVHVVGINTEFRVLFTFKGPKRTRFILHHYRAIPPKLKPNTVLVGGGPNLLEIAPPRKMGGRVEEKTKRYLMFLVRERNGRFAPVAGQQEVDGFSVQELSGETVD